MHSRTLILQSNWYTGYRAMPGYLHSPLQVDNHAEWHSGTLPGRSGHYISQSDKECIAPTMSVPRPEICRSYKARPYRSSRLFHPGIGQRDSPYMAQQPFGPLGRTCLPHIQCPCSCFVQSCPRTYLPGKAYSREPQFGLQHDIYLGRKPHPHSGVNPQRQKTFLLHILCM